jgi:hypothetical protein
MKRARLILGASLMLLVLLGGFSTTGLSSSRGSHCTDRCADRYKVRKEACKVIPLKHARKTCEEAAKAAKNECKRNCR